MCTHKKGRCDRCKDNGCGRNCVCCRMCVCPCYNTSYVHRNKRSADQLVTSNFQNVLQSRKRAKIEIKHSYPTLKQVQKETFHDRPPTLNALLSMFNINSTKASQRKSIDNLTSTRYLNDIAKEVIMPLFDCISDLFGCTSFEKLLLSIMPEIQQDLFPSAAKHVYTNLVKVTNDCQSYKFRNQLLSIFVGGKSTISLKDIVSDVSNITPFNIRQARKHFVVYGMGNPVEDEKFVIENIKDDTLDIIIDILMKSNAIQNCL